jgi:hypothetical protein
MPSRQIVDAFVADVLSNDHVSAIDRWYAEEAWTQENQGPPTVGRAQVLAKERRTMARMAAVESELVAPPLVDGATVALHWRFTFTTRDGARLAMEEVAWQVWTGDKVWCERFFYDPGQMRP